jgi:hypothetical protein|tara:strand:+ start:2550 stop:2717 length:168 start_codon:yes stop_codon:yes gene_type:complete
MIFRSIPRNYGIIGGERQRFFIPFLLVLSEKLPMAWAYHSFSPPAPGDLKSVSTL